MSIGYHFLIPRCAISVPVYHPDSPYVVSIPRPHQVVQKSYHDIIHYAKTHAKATLRCQASHLTESKNCEGNRTKTTLGLYTPPPPGAPLRLDDAPPLK